MHSIFFLLNKSNLVFWSWGVILIDELEKYSFGWKIKFTWETVCFLYLSPSNRQSCTSIWKESIQSCRKYLSRNPNKLRQVATGSLYLACIVGTVKYCQAALDISHFKLWPPLSLQAGTRHYPGMTMVWYCTVWYGMCGCMVLHTWHITLQL